MIGVCCWVNVTRVGHKIKRCVGRDNLSSLHDRQHTPSAYISECNGDAMKRTAAERRMLHGHCTPAAASAAVAGVAKF